MKKIFLSEEAGKPLKDNIISKGYEPVFTPVRNDFSHISSHTDLYMCMLGDGLYEGRRELVGRTYPADCIYNCFVLADRIIHGISADDHLLSIAASMGYSALQVKQGYCRCCALPVDSRSVITSDRGLAADIKKGLGSEVDILLITPGYIELPPYNYGFIGGCGGRVDDEILFNGNLALHPDADAIISFISDKGLKPVFFNDYPLRDIGSIFCPDYIIKEKI